MRKNISGQAFHCIAFNVDGRVTGDAANLSCTLAIDMGSRSALADTSATEIGTTGEYTFDLTAAETNGHELSFSPSSSTAGVAVLGTPGNIIYTETPLEAVRDELTTGTSNLRYITRNDTYDDIANSKLSWTVTTDYTGWTGTFTVRHRTTNATLISAAATVASATSITVTLTASDTALALLTDSDEYGPHPYDIQFVSGSSTKTPIRGVAQIKQDVTT